MFIYPTMFTDAETLPRADERLEDLVARELEYLDEELQLATDRFDFGDPAWD